MGEARKPQPIFLAPHDPEAEVRSQKQSGWKGNPDTPTSLSQSPLHRSQSGFDWANPVADLTSECTKQGFLFPRFLGLEVSDSINHHRKT
jgi:hypothetical protein